MQLFIPPTAIIAKGDSRSRLIYTDPSTGKIVIKKQTLDILDVRKFVDTHMVPSASALPTSKRGKNRAIESVVPPKYIMKTLDRNSGSA